MRKHCQYEVDREGSRKSSHTISYDQDPHAKTIWYIDDDDDEVNHKASNYVVMFDVDPDNISKGRITNTRRIRICRRHYDDCESLRRNYTINRHGVKEPHDTFVLRLPNGLEANVSRGGSYVSYRDHDGVAQDMPQELAVEFDNHLEEATGTHHKRVTN